MEKLWYYNREKDRYDFKMRKKPTKEVLRKRKEQFQKELKRIGVIK